MTEIPAWPGGTPWGEYYGGLTEKEKAALGARAMASNAYIRHTSGEITAFPDWDAVLDAHESGRGDRVILGCLDFGDAEVAEILASRKTKAER